MNQVEVQYIDRSVYSPTRIQFQEWVDAVLDEFGKKSEIVIRIVSVEESAQLNEQYRHKTGPTNILSFPFEAPEGIELDLLGDLVICAPVLEKEAAQQHKDIDHHWAHIVIHGVLHLLGLDHDNDQDAEIMESKEIGILKKLKINNPYKEAYNL